MATARLGTPDVLESFSGFPLRVFPRKPRVWIWGARNVCDFVPRFTGFRIVSSYSHCVSRQFRGSFFGKGVFGDRHNVIHTCQDGHVRDVSMGMFMTFTVMCAEHHSTLTGHEHY